MTNQEQITQHVAAEKFKMELDYWMGLLNQPNLTEETIKLINESIQRQIRFFLSPRCVMESN